MGAGYGGFSHRLSRRIPLLFCLLAASACAEINALADRHIIPRSWHFVVTVTFRYDLSMQTAPLSVESVSIDHLVLDPKNARLHPDENLSSIVGSLEVFGQREALVVRRGSNVVIGGNGRLAAMRQMGWSDAMVTYVDCTDEEATALGLALNRTAETATWDADQLEALLREVKDAGFAADAFGFSDANVDKLLRDTRNATQAALEANIEHVPAADVVEDEPAEIPAEPTSRPGDMYQLGRHRLRCGDSRNAHDVIALIGDERMDMVVTDPPYGVSYVGKTKDALTIQNDGKEDLQELLRDSLTLAMAHTKLGAVWYVAAPAGPQFLDFAIVLTELGIWRQTIVWVKNSLVMGHSDFHYRHEAIFYGWTPGAPHQQPADRKQDTIWEIDRPTRSTDHPTMKPVQLFAQQMEHSSKVGGLVYEPFCGSGTAIVAAEQTGRTCYGMEYDPRYVDGILRRFEKLTGQKPVLLNRDGDDQDVV
jgi:DNA modification methylase